MFGGESVVIAPHQASGARESNVPRESRCESYVRQTLNADMMQAAAKRFLTFSRLTRYLFHGLSVSLPENLHANRVHAGRQRQRERVCVSTANRDLTNVYLNAQRVFALGIIGETRLAKINLGELSGHTS